MTTLDRRYDIDWIRVIAIGLLLIYHVAIGLQPWGIMIGFITNDQPWNSLWIPMAMLNIWRIPLLFFVSGMGVYFAIQQRNWKQLLQERAIRILLPFLFGMFCIFPISVYIWQTYYKFDVSYSPHPGHLWFLGNIFIYVIFLLPVFFYLKRNESGKVVTWINTIFSTPLGLLIVIAAFVAEVIIINPMLYELYVMTWHGFILGLLAFFFGFCFILAGSAFWSMLLRWRWLFLAAGVVLFALRMVVFAPKVPGYLLVVESQCWMYAVLAFGYKYLNHPSKVLRYLSEAAYPVYILHMIFLFLASSLLFPLEIEPPLKFLLTLLFTTGSCVFFYEMVVKRIKFIRLLFGMKLNNNALGYKHEKVHVII